jgi:uncharacterized membrane protein YfcA
MEQYHWFVPLGFLLGAYGTLVGAGGAFILVPILLLMYPDARPETITSISLAVVFFNCLSGSIAYAGTKRIDYKSGLLFSVATVPGAILGTLATNYVKRGVFDALLGVVLIIASIFIYVRPGPVSRPKTAVSPGQYRRVLVDSTGETYDFSFNLPLGLALSFFIGFMSSLLGIGGGIIHVPVLILLLQFPVHIATATSHFMLAIMALTATLIHVGTGGFEHGGIQRTIVLSIGMIIGAQLGAILSPRLRGSLIVRALAIALALVGLRLIWVASQAPHLGGA